MSIRGLASLVVMIASQVVGKNVCGLQASIGKFG